jgi:hypothetical protein
MKTYVRVIRVADKNLLNSDNQAINAIDWNNELSCMIAELYSDSDWKQKVQAFVDDRIKGTNYEFGCGGSHCWLHRGKNTSDRICMWRIEEITPPVVGSQISLYRNQNWRSNIVLAITDTEALVEYTAGNGDEHIVVVNITKQVMEQVNYAHKTRSVFPVVRNYKKELLPKKWQALIVN